MLFSRYRAITFSALTCGLLLAGCNNTYTGDDTTTGDIAADGWEKRAPSSTVTPSLLFPVIGARIVSAGHVARSSGGGYSFSVDQDELTGFIYLVGGVLDIDRDGAADDYNEPFAGGFAAPAGSRYINPASALIAAGYTVSGSRDFAALAKYGPDYDFDAAAEGRKDFLVYKALSIAMVTVLAEDNTMIPSLQAKRDAEAAADDSSSSANSEGASSGDAQSSSSSISASSEPAASDNENTGGELCDFGPCDIGGGVSALVYIYGMSLDDCEAYGGIYDKGSCGFDGAAVNAILGSMSSSSEGVAPVMPETGQSESSSAGGLSGSLYLFDFSAEDCEALNGVYDFAESSCRVDAEGIGHYFGAQEDELPIYTDENGSEILMCGLPGTVTCDEYRAEGACDTEGKPMCRDSAYSESQGGGNATARSARPIKVVEQTNKEAIIQMQRDCDTRECLDAITAEVAAARNGIAGGI